MPASELVQSLSRGLTMLEHIAASDDGLMLTQICEALQLKAPTAHNLLRTLLAHGFVEKATSPTRYRLGPATARLADQHRERALLRQVETAILALQSRFPAGRFNFIESIGGEAVTTLRLTPELPGRVQRGPMQSMAPYTTASALIYQALWPAEVRAAYRRRYPFAEYGRHRWTSLDELDAFLDRVRRLGYAAPTFHDDRHYRVAVPVFGSGRRFVGVIGASLTDAFDDPAFDPAILLNAVLAAADGLSTDQPSAPDTPKAPAAIPPEPQGALP